MAEICVFFATPPSNPVIETSEETPPGQGYTDNYLFNGVRAITMCKNIAPKRNAEDLVTTVGTNTQWIC